MSSILHLHESTGKFMGFVIHETPPPKLWNLKDDSFFGSVPSVALSINKSNRWTLPLSVSQKLMLE